MNAQKCARHAKNVKCVKCRKADLSEYTAVMNAEHKPMLNPAGLALGTDGLYKENIRKAQQKTTKEDDP